MWPEVYYLRKPIEHELKQGFMFLYYSAVYFSDLFQDSHKVQRSQMIFWNDTLQPYNIITTNHSFFFSLRLQ